MNRELWSAIGILCGASLGVIVPVGMAHLIEMTTNDAAGIGTPFALLTIFTFPLGIVFGAYAGRYRARMGHWKGVFDASTNNPTSAESPSIELAQTFSTLETTLVHLSREESISAKRSYLQNLIETYESTKLNYRLLGIWLFATLLVPVLVVFPLKMVWKHYRSKKTLEKHIQEVRDAWFDIQSPETPEDVAPRPASDLS